MVSVSSKLAEGLSVLKSSGTPQLARVSKPGLGDLRILGQSSCAFLEGLGFRV